MSRTSRAVFIDVTACRIKENLSLIKLLADALSRHDQIGVGGYESDAFSGLEALADATLTDLETLTDAWARLELPHRGAR